MRAATMTIETLRMSPSLVITALTPPPPLVWTLGPSLLASRTARSPRSSSAAESSSRARSSSSCSIPTADRDLFLRQPCSPAGPAAGEVVREHDQFIHRLAPVACLASTLRHLSQARPERALATAT
jgi:hypothetical protein